MPENDDTPSHVELRAEALSEADHCVDTAVRLLGSGGLTPSSPQERLEVMTALATLAVALYARWTPR
jgi:hypothetical protein